MVRKGLCISCVNDKTCAFPRKFPVWQCEEFSDFVSLKPTKRREVKKERSKTADEITPEE